MCWGQKLKRQDVIYEDIVINVSQNISDASICQSPRCYDLY